MGWMYSRGSDACGDTPNFATGERKRFRAIRKRGDNEAYRKKRFINKLGSIAWNLSGRKKTSSSSEDRLFLKFLLRVPEEL